MELDRALQDASEGGKVGRRGLQDAGMHRETWLKGT